jgi:hypothetical protein
MSRAGRLPAVRICLLILGVVLLSATVAASVHLSQATASPSAAGASASAAKHGKSSAARRATRQAKCVPAPRAGKHRKSHKARAGKHHKAHKARKTCPGNRGIFHKLLGGALPANALDVPGPAPAPGSTPKPGSTPAPGSSPQSPGGSGSSPGEPIPPVETTPHEEPPPVVEKPPHEEPPHEEPPHEEPPHEEPPHEEPPHEEPPHEEPPHEEPTPFRFFSPSSFWNEPLPVNAPLDPTSAAVVGAFDEVITKAQEAKKGLPTINTTSWSIPIYTVPGTQATVKVTYEVPYAGKPKPTLEAAWDAVPLPPEAKPAAGTDRHLVVWQPSTDKLWEFWGLEKTEAGWLAKWGGAIENVSSNSGSYGPEAWPGATTSWGASATSLSIAGGLITLEDFAMGQINHALAMALPDVRAGVYASPAHRSDGGDTEPLSLPEGAHLRLDPSLDLASLHLPKLTLMLAEAAQRYGIVVRDQAANVALYGQDPTPTGTNPYAGAGGYFEGKSPSKLLESFPWSHLQLLKMELHKTSG